MDSNMTTLQQMIDEWMSAFPPELLAELTNKSRSEIQLATTIITALSAENHKLRTALRAYEHGASSIARDALNEGKEA
jgi:hypothetical protein